MKRSLRCRNLKISQIRRKRKLRLSVEWSARSLPEKIIPKLRRKRTLMSVQQGTYLYHQSALQTNSRSNKDTRPIALRIVMVRKPEGLAKSFWIRHISSYKIRIKSFLLNHQDRVQQTVDQRRARTFCSTISITLKASWAIRPLGTRPDRRWKISKWDRMRA